MKVRKSTLWKLAAWIYLPVLAYLCGALIAQGFVDTLARL